MKQLRSFTIGLGFLLLVGMSSAWAQVQLEFWYSGNEEQRALMTQIVEEYNQEVQNDVTILLVEAPPGRELVATALAAGQGPDLLWHNHNVPWFYGVEAVYPLNDFVLDPEIGIDAEQLFPAARQTVQFGGVVMAIPMVTGPGALIYNKRIFREAGLTDEDVPTTWEEVEEIAKRLTQRDGRRVAMWGMTASSVDWFMQELVLTNGGDWINDDATEYLPNPEALVEGLQWLHSLVHEHEVMPVPRGVSWTGGAQMLAEDNSFQLEQAAMMVFNGIGSVTSYLNENPDLELGAVPSPLGPSSGGVRTISPGYDGIHVIAATQHPREAYLFAKWLFEEKILDFLHATHPGGVPTTTAALQDPRFAESPYLGPMIEAMQTARLRNFHNFPGRLDVRSQEPAVAERVILNSATPEVAVSEFKQHAAQVFQLWEPDLIEFRTNHEVVW